MPKAKPDLGHAGPDSVTGMQVAAAQEDSTTAWLRSLVLSTSDFLSTDCINGLINALHRREATQLGYINDANELIHHTVIRWTVN